MHVGKARDVAIVARKATLVFFVDIGHSFRHTCQMVSPEYVAQLVDEQTKWQRSAREDMTY